MISDPPTGDAAIDGVYYLDYMSDAPPGDPSQQSPNGRYTGGPDPDWSSLPYICTLPENLSADDSISSPGNCSWQWSLSAKDIEGNDIMLPTTPGGDPFIGPWRSWWRLRYGGDTVIASGPFTSINTKLGDDFISVAGQTWEAYMTRWFYPFNPNPPLDPNLKEFQFPKAFIGNEDSPGATSKNTAASLQYECLNRDIALIAHDILVQCRDAVPNRMFFNFIDLLNPIGITDNLQLSWGDTTTMDSFINNLAGTGEGFDWWINWQRRFNFGSPYRFGDTHSPTIAYTITLDTPGLLDLEYNNQGIQGNHVYGTGAGFATSSTLASAWGYDSADGGQQQFSRLDVNFDYGDVRNRASLVKKTKKSLSLAIDPVRSVPISLDPALIPNYWQIFRKGIAVFIAIDTGFNQINAAYQLKNWSLNDENNTGNMKVDLTLERIYPQFADFGNAEG